MHVLDVNKDGRNDVLTTMAHSFGVLWFEQKADGTLGPAPDRQQLVASHASCWPTSTATARSIS